MRRLPIPLHGAFDGLPHYDVPYGENFNVNFLPEELVVDVYTPEGDTQEARPLVVIAHGGFSLWKQRGVDVPFCEDLAQMGYVVASMSYRLGVNILGDLPSEFVKAVWRGVHDSRAAVRSSVTPWITATLGHYTNRIYLGG